MMNIPTSEAIWSHFIREMFSMETALYALFAVAIFAVIILALEFLDSTKAGDE